eukprot:CAMPEP_0176426980 /NCGR_PEP_ID=MMETSP0127-20121128/12262_1 /TAXON_ID=938130 /ORGANISM="Platyophrya macrostoma, Strain WH" /LENGTH=184 /DNA_ID=CAMNT_0017808345 /DNA_START=17 /DNA_END=571 /DNA_ORIENTATION=-
MTSSLSAATSGAAHQQAARTVLHGLYRRLRENGEDPRMIRRALSVNPLETNVKTAKSFLEHHRRLVEISSAQSQLRFFHVVRKLRLRIQRQYHIASLFSLRLQQASVAALSDALVYALMAAILFFLYQMYRLCRVGLNRADEKYQALAIPVIQTIEALEMMEVFRNGREKQHEELDEDIRRERK